jgi:hypothetical protein
MKRSTIVVAFATVLATLVAASAAFAGDSHGKTLYRYVGQLKAVNGSSLTITVQNGNRPALRSLLGQSQDQTFTTDAKTVFLKWDKGIPTQLSDAGKLTVNDYVTVNVRSDRDAPIATITGTPAALVGDRGSELVRPDKPLYLFRGTFVSTADGKVTIDVQGGNRKALRLMIGQVSQQTFTTDGSTVFLHWAHRVPTVVDAGALKAGDRIVIRIRADRDATLTTVESTPAARVADREPKAQEEQQSAQSQ